ncbi:MAG: aminotransferase class III-fold pyridoxal phosphate-dependent enzyme [Acidobacteria bacterium]|nr:aminotransferase class III-fold pyridoxal phosphate-dependent enzyme [Acidobacteriota bacterium]
MPYFQKSISASYEYERRVKEEMPSPHVPREVARLVFSHAEGPYLFDLDGNQYIDLDNGKGAVLLGHNDPDVRHSLMEHLEMKRTVATGRNDIIRQLATKISQDVGEDIAVAFFRTGTSAVRAATHLARLWTGKPLLLSAGYHGWDPMWQLNSDLFEPNTCGVINFYFIPELLQELLSRYKDQVAAIVISPDHVYLDDNYFRQLFEECHRWPGVLIIDDQVKQGYRYKPGSSLSNYGLQADITVFSKALSNGSDLSCVCGNRTIMDMARHFVYTSYFDILPITAALTTLEKLTRINAQEYIKKTANGFLHQFRCLLKDSSLPIEIAGDGNLFRLVFATNELEAAFYAEAVINGIIFHEWDNQCPSAALTPEVYGVLLKRLQCTLEVILRDFAYLRGTPISDEARWRAAWNQMDGFSNLNLPLDLRLNFIKQCIIEEIDQYPIRSF